MNSLYLETAELALQLESAKANAMSQAEARAAAEKAKADAELEVRRIKRQFSTELRSSSSQVAKSQHAVEQVQMHWQETAIRRRRFRILSDTFMAWVYLNYEGQVHAAATDHATKQADARIAEAEAELERQRSTHVQELSELEQSIRGEHAEDLQKAERQSEHLRTLFVEGAIRRMRSSAMSRAFVAWADAAWAREMASLESLEALAREEAQARQAAELLAAEATEACAAAEAAATAAQTDAAEAQLRHQAELEAEQAAKLATHAKLTEQTELLAQEQEKARQLEQAQAATQDEARAAAEQAAKHAEHVETVKTVFQGAAIRRMRHGLVSRAFRSWSDAAVDAMFEKQMKDLQAMADSETEARKQAQDAERQAREEADAANAKVEVLTEAAESTAMIKEEAAQAKAQIKKEADARSTAEQATAVAKAEAAEADERLRAVVEAEMATQAKLVAQAEQLAEEREKALELQQSRSAIQEEARAATAQAAKHSEAIDTVQQRWQGAAIRRMRHGLVSRCFRAWSDVTIDIQFDLQLDELQKLANEETEKRRAAQEAERVAREEAEVASRKALQQEAAVATEIRLRHDAEARLQQALADSELVKPAGTGAALPATPTTHDPSTPTKSTLTSATEALPPRRPSAGLREEHAAAKGEVTPEREVAPPVARSATPIQRTPIQMVATPSSPMSASRGRGGAAYFKVMQRSVVRAGIEMDSPKKKEMEVGDVIEVEETALNSKGTLRVRFSGGWTSVQSGGGVQILERCDAEGHPLSAQPQPNLEL